MLWYKSWLETRWRFLIGLALVICSAASSVLTYPAVLRIIESLPAMNVSGPLGQRIRESAELARSFPGFVWSEVFRQNLAQLSTLFAILLGIATVVSHSGGALFTLSLPISRPRLLGIRAVAGLAELFVLALASSLVIPILAPAIGRTYTVSSALVHALCLFVAASVFFSFAFLLSTIFGDVWRPLLIALAVAFVMAIADQLLHSPPYSLFRVMSGETWFRAGRLPWLGLLASAAASAALYRIAVAHFTRRDF